MPETHRFGKRPKNSSLWKIDFLDGNFINTKNSLKTESLEIPASGAYNSFTISISNCDRVCCLSLLVRKPEFISASFQDLTQLSSLSP